MQQILLFNIPYEGLLLFENNCSLAAYYTHDTFFALFHGIDMRLTLLKC